MPHPSSTPTGFPGRGPRLSRDVPVALVAVCGTAISLVGWYLFDRWERAMAQHDATREATYVLREYPSGIEASVGVLVGGLLLTIALAGYLIWIRVQNARTARLVAERTAGLHESAERYRTLVQASPEAIFIYRDGPLVFANPAAARLVRANSVDQILGMNSLQFAHPDDCEFIIRRRAELVRGEGALEPAQLRFLLLDGDEAFVETCSTTILWEGRQANLVMVRDVSERARAEMALRESEQRFRDFAASASDWLWETDADHRYTWISESFRHTSELTPELLRGLTHWEVEGIDSDLDELKRAMKSEIPFRGIRFSRIDDKGERTHRIINGRPRFDETGRFIGYRGTTTDITAEIDARHEASRIHAQFVNAVESMSDSIALYDPDDRLVLCNEESRRFSGVSPELLRPGVTYESVLRARIESGLLDDEIEGSREDWIGRRLATHRNPSGNYTFRVGDRWRRVYEERLSDGSTILLGTDVTDQMRMAEELRESEAQLRLVIDTVPAEIVYLDSDHRVRFANRGYAERAGISTEDLVGMHMQDIRGEEWYGKNEESLRRTVAGETTYVDGQIPGPNGSTIHYSVTRVPHFGDDGNVVGYFAVVIDMTERHQREEQLRQAQKMEAVGQLTGGVAHEFNNLLMVVLGNLELLGEDLEGDTGKSRLVETAKKSAIRGGELTQRLLAFSRRQDLRSKRIDLNALVDETAGMLRGTLGETITVEISAAPDLWPTVADPGQVEAALLNFAINSRDAMPKGGTITIRTANVTVNASDLGAQSDAAPGDYVVLEVGDTGDGMEPQVIDHAFEPFYTTKGVGEGSGLGLSMAYGFARQSGGFATIESVSGHGATVRLYLPRAAAPEITASRKNDRADVVPRGSGTILAVEDDVDVRNLVVGVLTGLGYDVVQAGDGESALALLDARADIDLLFSDVVLPDGMSGPEIAKRARRRRPDLKVVFTTGYAEAGLGDLTLDGAAAGLIHKPYRKAELAREIAAALGSG